VSPGAAMLERLLGPIIGLSHIRVSATFYKWEGSFRCLRKKKKKEKEKRKEKKRKERKKERSIQAELVCLLLFSSCHEIVRRVAMLSTQTNTAC
jgi:hypothetical protein